MLSRVKLNDLVVVIAGKNKGKQGRVIAIDHTKEKVMVKGIAVVTSHRKPKRQGEKGGIVTEESFIAISNVMPVCPSCNKGSRVRVKFIEGGVKKIRVCHCKNETPLD